MARSPLHPLHERLGARFTDFGGWEMPLHYGSVIAEHRSVREEWGWFDVTHLGRFRWEGPGATEALRRLCSNDVARISGGQTQYTMLLNERGGVIDDLVVWRWDEERYWVFPNAANHERVMAAFASEAPTVALEDLQTSTAALAVQGPRAPSVLEEVIEARPRRFRTLQGTFETAQVSGAGTGYTGERGGELVVPNALASELAERLVAGGGQPCGLGARDTLRLEAGLPLWGQDLDEDTTPLEAGLDFAVAFTRSFRGSEALERQRREGVARRLVAFWTEGRQIPRPGYRLWRGSGEGRVTSGNWSPMLERGIGFGYLPTDASGDIEVEIRSTWVPAEEVEPPFLSR